MLSRTPALALLMGMLMSLGPATATAQFSPWEMAAARDQTPKKDTVSAVGVATVKRPASALRMHVELLGKGKTLEEALAKLKERRTAALTQLQTLKATKDSIVVASPNVRGLQVGRRRQMEMMIAQRLAGRGKKTPKGLQVPESVAIAATLTAEWPLEGKSPEELLVAAQRLEEKIKAADLGGIKDAEKPSPEEEELAEEMAQMMRDSGEPEVPVGQPQFVFAARLSEADREKALAEAFQKARVQAAQLAKAAGIGLGPLVAISGQGGGNVGDLGEDPYDNPYAQQYLRRLRTGQATETPEEQANESIGRNPDGLNFTFTVSAMFAIGK